MFVLVPLQIVFVAEFVTAGAGFTLTIIILVGPVQDPVMDVGVTRYSTVPWDVVLGLVSIWLMVAPKPALAPVMLPEIVPIVHVKLLCAVAAKIIFGLVPLHIVAVVAVVIVGTGLTVTITVCGVPTQDPPMDVAVTM